MAELLRDLKKHLQDVDNIGDESPVPLLDLGQDLVMVFELLSPQHIQQSRFQHHKAFKHQVGRVPASGHILPEYMKIKGWQKYRYPTWATVMGPVGRVALAPRGDRCKSWLKGWHGCIYSWIQISNLLHFTMWNYLQFLMRAAMLGLCRMQSLMQSCKTWQTHLAGFRWLGRCGTSSSLKTPIWLLAVSEMINSVTWVSDHSSNSFTIHSAMLAEVWRSEKGTHPRTSACRRQSELM